MLLPQKATSVHTSTVRQSNIWLDFMEKSGREGHQYKSKGQPTTTLQDQENQLQVFKKLQTVSQERQGQDQLRVLGQRQG